MEEKLMEAVERLEQAVARFEAKVSVEAEASVSKIVATVASGREEELERKLADAEAKVVELQAAGGGRKTAGVGRMFAKEGAVGEGALDGALAGLSVEQRLAVKGELMRAGLIG